LVWKKCTEAVWGSLTASISIKAGMIFMVISSLGAFWLALLMATHAPGQSYYFSALYFFLHFQYNGWFFFGILGLWLGMLPAGALNTSTGLHQGVVWMIAACVPAVALSGLWMKVPVWLYGIAVFAAFMQLGAVYLAWKPVRQMIPGLASGLSKTQKLLLSVSAFSFLVRIGLQALSTVPALSKFGFAYRPVVIGYLHLILLGCISLFLLAHLFGKNLWSSGKKAAHYGIIIFITGIFFTESTLMVQGLGYIGWINIPYTNDVLLGAAVLMFTGLLLLNIKARTGSEK
jgi:hypothetical protein